MPPGGPSDAEVEAQTRPADLAYVHNPIGAAYTDSGDLTIPLDTSPPTKPTMSTVQMMGGDSFALAAYDAWASDASASAGGRPAPTGCASMDTRDNVRIMTKGPGLEADESPQDRGYVRLVSHWCWLLRPGNPPNHRTMPNPDKQNKFTVHLKERAKNFWRMRIPEYQGRGIDTFYHEKDGFPKGQIGIRQQFRVYIDPKWAPNARNLEWCRLTAWGYYTGKGSNYLRCKDHDWFDL